MNELTQKEIEYFMQLALDEAKLASMEGEVPVGAVLVDVNGLVIASDHNRREAENSAISHAEINVIKAANQKLDSWRLLNTRLFVTVEPCLMCAGAIIQARIPEVYFGIKDQKFGAVESIYKTLDDPRNNHRVSLIRGEILSDESTNLMQKFFNEIRDKRQK